MKIVSKNWLCRNDIIFFLVVFLFRVTLELNYVFVISKMYLTHDLLTWGVYKLEVVGYKYLLSWIINIFFIILIQKFIIINLRSSSEIILFALFMMSFIPSISLYGLANISNQYLAYFLLFWLVLVFFTNIFRSSIQYDGIKNIMPDKNNKKLLILGLILICISIICIYIYYNGFTINFTLNTEEQYKIRHAIYAQGENKLINYIRNWSMSIIIPLAAIIFISKKKWLFVLFMVLLQVLLYGIDMQKMALLILPASVFAYLFYKENMINLVPIILVLFNVLSFVEFYGLKSRFILNNLIIRLYYIPAILSNCYFEYIEETHYYVVPASSIFSRLGLIKDYHYNIGLSYMIGEKYFGTSDISANTGMFGSAYSYGIFGVILIPVIYALLFVILDKVTKGLKINIFISIILLEVYAITGVSIFVVLLPYGFIIALLILSVLKKNKGYFNPIKRKHKTLYVQKY